jgi:hypothetical protein
MSDRIEMRPASFSVLEADPETGLPGVYLAVTVPGAATMIATVSPHTAQTLAKALLVASIMVGHELGIDLNRAEPLQ